jgi:hypothetical protein
MSVIDCEPRSEKSLADPLRECPAGQVQNRFRERPEAGICDAIVSIPKADTRFLTAVRDEDLYLIKEDPQFKNLESDLRYKAFLQKMNLLE